MNMRVRGRVLSTLFCSLLVVAGCSQPSTPTTAELYAEDFHALKTQFEGREPMSTMLEDDRLTEAEILELQKVFAACLTDAGYSDVTFDDMWGSFGVRDDGKERTQYDADFKRCGNDTGFHDIVALYRATAQNPNKVDELELTVDCMVRNGAVDPTYSVEQYKREFEEWLSVKGQTPGELPGSTFSYAIDPDEGVEILKECGIDPRYARADQGERVNKPPSGRDGL